MKRTLFDFAFTGTKKQKTQQDGERRLEEASPSLESAGGDCAVTVCRPTAADSEVVELEVIVLHKYVTTSTYAGQFCAPPPPIWA